MKPTSRASSPVPAWVRTARLTMRASVLAAALTRSGTAVLRTEPPGPETTTL
jgi:hypothetical protein